MSGDSKHFPPEIPRKDNEAQADYSPLKSGGRDALFVWLKSEFPDAEKRSKYTIRFTHGGRVYSIRQTANSIRVFPDGGESFEISECSRWMAVRIIILAVRHGIDRQTPGEAAGRRAALGTRVKAGLA